MTNKLLLAAIAFGLWANAAVTLIRPAVAQSDALISIANDIHTLIRSGIGCQNHKICD